MSFTLFKTRLPKRWRYYRYIVLRAKMCLKFFSVTVTSYRSEKRSCNYIMKLAINIVPVNSNVVFYDHSWRNILLYIYSRGISCHQSLESWLVCVKHMQHSAVMQLP
jgi:hypothetical protein